MLRNPSKWQDDQMAAPMSLSNLVRFKIFNKFKNDSWILVLRFSSTGRDINQSIVRFVLFL